MRSNGLTASAYVPVADLDPLLAEAVLAELRERMVAAYSKPVEPASLSGIDRPDFRVDVKERLYVDARAAEEVSTLLSARDPGLVEPNDDLIWAQIVAGFDQTATDPTATPPGASEPETTGEAPSAADLDARWADELRSGQSGAELPPSKIARVRRQFGVSGHEIGADDRYIPPPPPPLPRLEPYQQIAWICLIAGPTLLVLSVIFRFTLPSWLSMLAALGFIAGFLTLIATMGNGSDDTWGSDDGAVV